LGHPERKAGIAGWLLISIIIYCALGAVAYASAFLLLQNGKAIDLPWIGSAQKKLYRAGMGPNTNNWVGQRECISDDPDLVYKPTPGTCGFKNIEFDTTLTFTSEGRNTGTRPPGTGIAVIGDSHSMGWGVNDLDTYAAVLQALTGRPVYNLAVAGYGTAREFIRLRKSGLVDKVDTIIIQYCNNDYHDNITFRDTPLEDLRERVARQFVTDQAMLQDRIGYITRGYWLSLKAPISSLADKLRRKNFGRHYGPFMEIVRKNADLLEGKRVIVFYSNPFGQKYRNYPEGPDADLPNLTFLDLGLDWNDHFMMDGHLSPVGHRNVAVRLSEHLHGVAVQPH
jgi:hypothetical protein